MNIMYNIVIVNQGQLISGELRYFRDMDLRSEGFENIRRSMFFG